MSFLYYDLNKLKNDKPGTNKVGVYLFLMNERMDVWVISVLLLEKSIVPVTRTAKQYFLGDKTNNGVNLYLGHHLEI